MTKLVQTPLRRAVAVLAATTLASTPLAAAANPGHTLTVRALDHTGAPIADGTVLIAGLGSETEFRDVPVHHGTATIRVPQDDLIEISRTSGRDVRVLTAVNVPITAATTATLDFRAAKPLTMAVPNPEASPAIIHRSYRYARRDRAIQGDHDARDGGRLSSVPPERPRPATRCSAPLRPSGRSGAGTVRSVRSR